MLLDIVARDCYFSTQKVEAGGCTFEASLEYVVRPCLKKWTKVCPLQKAQLKREELQKPVNVCDKYMMFISRILKDDQNKWQGGTVKGSSLFLKMT